MKQKYLPTVHEHYSCSKFEYSLLILALFVSSFGFAQSIDAINSPINGEKSGNPTLRSTGQNSTNNYRMPPSNDEPCSATSIPMNTCVSSTTVGATQTQSACAGNANDDVWFSFVATSTNVDILVTDGSLNDSVFELFSGTCGSLTSIGCVDSSYTDEFASATVTIGNTYFIRVNSYGGSGNQGTFDLCVYSYCIPTSNYTTTRYISNFTTTGGVSNINNNSGVGTTIDGYSDFTAISASQNTSGTLNFSASYNDWEYGIVIWVDWNNNGDFTDAGEKMYGSTSRATSHSGSFTVSGTAGSYRLRIRADRGQNNTNSLTSCGYNNNTEAEDYTLIVMSSSPPTISSFSSSSGCVGSSLTITGTNLSGASSVNIGGSATTITGNTATTITVTVGSGTTGTVSVTTGGGSVTSAGTFTVNPLPANPGNPNSNSPQCNPTGVTLTRVGTPPGGVTWFWQTAANGTSTTNSGATYVVNTSGTYYLRAQNNTTGCWSSGSGSRAVVVNNPISTVASAPSPSNSETGVCYAGSGTVSNLTWTAATGATSYDVYFGAGSLPGAVTATVATNSYPVTLAANTTYYWRILPSTTCGASSGSPITWSFTTSTIPCYCTPYSTNTTSFIDDFSTTGGLTNITNNNTGTGITSDGYSDYTVQSASQIAGNTINFSTDFSYNSVTYGFNIWIDWNQDGSFASGEIVYASGAYVTNATGNFTIPVATSAGDYVMRIRNDYDTTNPDPCNSIRYGEAEDYTLNVIASTPCSEPTAQPTNLVLSETGTTINGAFTAASPAPNSYLVVYNTTNTTPNPADGTTYTIGGTVGAGNTVADTDGNTNFSVSGLAGGTTYYFFVFAYNNSSCIANYYTTNPLTGNETTTVSYCEPSVSNNYQDDTYIRRVDFVGTLKNTTNSSTYSNSPRGYQDFTGLPVANISKQAQGEGVNVYAEYEIPSNPVYVKAWVDWNKNGDFTDSGELVYNTDNLTILSSTFGFIIPTTQTTGFYRIRIRASESGGGFAYGPCGNIDHWGETEDYLFEVVAKCDNIITNVTDGVACGTNQNVILEFEGSSGATGFEIYTNETGGSPLSPSPTFTAGVNPTGTWSTPAISSAVSYWVTAINGCESLKRTEVIANIKPVPTLSFTPNTPVLCGEDHIVEIYAYGDKETAYLIDEDFEGSANNGLGSFSRNHYSSNNTVSQPTKTQWTQRTSTYIPDELVWFPAIASDFGANKFVMSNSDINARTNGGNIIPFQNELRSATVNSTAYLNLTLKFDMYYSDYYEGDNAGSPTGDYVRVRVSTNGGSTWTQERLDYNTDVGVGTKFDRININLDAYINEPNLVVSFYYHSNFWSDGVALDNIQLYGEKPLSSNFDWSITADAYTDPGATVPYIFGTSAPTSTIYVRPTPAQLQNSLFTFTATATLENGCDASTDITIANNTKYFSGPNNTYTDWNNANNWKPSGVPTSDNCVIIPDTYTGVINGTTDGDALNVTVKDGGDLSIEPDGTLTIVDFLDIQSTGVFEIESGGSLIQVNNVINSGIGTVKRNSTTSSSSDYVYWSSPVNNFNISNLPGNAAYSWTPTIGGNYGNWAVASGVMEAGKGYIKRAGANGIITSNFTNRINNGDISISITRGTYIGGDYSGAGGTMATKLDDNWNLIGNPYPSAISADAFILQNAALLDDATDPNSPTVMGTVYLWRHLTAPSSSADPFYGNFLYNYNPNDYIGYNSTGSNPAGFSGNIASGQGFFVLMDDNAPAATSNVVFNNIMRDAAYNNNQFYRTTQDVRPIERHRIWLDLIAPNNMANSILVGYIENATNEIDRLYDGYELSETSTRFYSLIDEEKMAIQGKALPFSDSDTVPLGIVIPQHGSYSIAINTLDGLFEDESQDIYLEDLDMNIIHNLRSQPYSFHAESGSFDNRFVLRYTNNSLSIEQHNEIAGLSITAPESNYIKVKSSKDVIKNIEVYDVLGRVIYKNKDILKSEVIINDLNSASGALIVKVTLANGLQKTQKIILK